MHPAPIDVLIPDNPAVEGELRRALSRDAERRLRRVLGSWRRLARPRPPHPRSAGAPGAGPVRCWLAEVEDALALARAAAACLAVPARRRRSSAAWSRLVDRVADEG